MAFAAIPTRSCFPRRSANPSVPKYLGRLATVKIESFSHRPLFVPSSANPNLSRSLSIDNGDNNDNIGGGGLGKGGGGSGGHDGNSSSGGGGGGLNPLAALNEAQRSRRVLMEELAAGDMATRPNFGLDSALSAVVIGSLIGVALMYLWAPTLAPSSSSTSLPSYIFQPGPFPPSARLATLFYKGLIFGAVGFASGLAGAAVWNGLVAMRRRKEDKDAKEEEKKGPKTVLNAATGAVHMGVSSYLRYQTLDAVVEFLMAKAMLVGVFKGTVVELRCLINVAGGFASGLAGTVRKKEKDAKKKKKGPKTVLNVATWAVHMGVSSYLRYQTFDAVVEFLMAKAMSVGVFKATAVVVNAGWCVQG